MRARVTSLDLRCPTCASEPGARCHQLDGSGPTTPHPARRKRAAEEHLRRNPEHVRGQLPLFPLKRAA